MNQYYLDDSREKGEVVRQELGHVGIHQRSDESQIFVHVGVASLQRPGHNQHRLHRLCEFVFFRIGGCCVVSEREEGKGKRDGLSSGLELVQPLLVDFIASTKLVRLTYRGFKPWL